MAPTTLKSVATGDAAFNPSTTVSVSAARFPRAGAPFRKLALTIAVWTLYVPHLAFVKILGPRLGLRWARSVGRVHWLLTFLGAEGSTWAIMRSLYPHLRTKISVSTILRKHLELKHECFARIRAFGQQRAFDPPYDVVWELDATSRQRFQQLRSGRRGLIIVGYHFGFFRLSASALARVFPGCDAVHVSHRIAHYEGETISRVARLALEKALVADEQSGTRIHYVDGESSILRIFRLLRSGDVVAIAADGAFAKDFVNVPFLGGKLRLPCGWARLAAATHSDVLVLADTTMDGRHRKVWLFDHVRVDDGSSEAIYRAVSQAAAILEDLLRREPWSWHPWRRLREETTDDGSLVRSIMALGPDRRMICSGNRQVAPLQSPVEIDSEENCNGFYKSIEARRNGGTAMNAHQTNWARDPSENCLQHKPRRVAIVANSFTPYRIYVHQRIAREVPEVELWTLMTHGNSYNRWQGLEPPEEIRPQMFGNGEPTIEQTKLKFALREWRKFGRIIRWLEKHQIEGVICQGFGDVGRLRLLRWCYRRSITCFLTADCNINGDVRRGPKRLLKHLVVRQAIRWSSGVMPCGEYGRMLFERYGAKPDKTFMFPLISDLQLFSNPPQQTMRQVREQYAFDQQRRRILYCGRMMQVKRPDLTIAAFTALARQRPDWDLVMVGEGPLREVTTASVPSDLAGRVMWLGLIQDTSQLASVFAQCDVLVLPSDKEPWGMVVIEAAASGMALVMTDVVGASPELVSNGENGRVFRPGNLAAYIAALCEVTHPDHIDQMKTNSRRVLAQWMAQSDPVNGFRAAMASRGLIPYRLVAIASQSERGFPERTVDKQKLDVGLSTYSQSTSIHDSAI